jgi:phosphotransferase system HPr-like phosphotransfer protein
LSVSNQQYKMDTCYISFEKKADIFSYEYLQCLLFIDNIKDSNYLFTKKLYTKLITSSQILEDFLDFHGAKKNKEWFYYRELSATIRHLSLACYSQRHIFNRFNYYVFDEGIEYDVFKQEAVSTLRILQETVKAIGPVVLQEAEKLSIEFPEQDYELDNFPEVSAVPLLDHNIDDFNAKDQQKTNLTRISSEFLEIVRAFDQFAFYEPYDLKSIRQIVPEQFNEVTARRYEMLIHNLQSSFDSYVVNTKSSPENTILEQLRSHFSIVLHILQMAGRLLHLYERHLYDSGFKDEYKIVSEGLAKLVDPDVILKCAVNYCLFYAWKFLSSGEALASEILNANMETSVIEVGIPKDRGFHSRPSLLVAKIVRHYGGEVKMIVNSDVFDASSVLDLQWAGGKISKEKIQKVRFKGDVRSLDDIKMLAGINYGEDSMGKGVPLPKELHYLY